jgi:thiamine-phosphate pyrophosphorylase
VKPGAVKASPDLLRQARREIDLPIVAIGGITVHNGAKLLEAGADALAVVSSVFGADDIQAAARQFSSFNFSETGSIVRKTQHGLAKSTSFR